jgi:hypothetical protein
MTLWRRHQLPCLGPVSTLITGNISAFRNGRQRDTYFHSPLPVTAQHYGWYPWLLSGISLKFLLLCWWMQRQSLSRHVRCVACCVCNNLHSDGMNKQLTVYWIVFWLVFWGVKSIKVPFDPTIISICLISEGIFRSHSWAGCLQIRCRDTPIFLHGPKQRRALFFSLLM